MCALPCVVHSLYSRQPVYEQKTQQVKFSDDTPLTGFIITSGNTPGCRGEACGLVQRQLPSSQTSKTKETVLDFTRDLPIPCPLVINGEEQVPSFRHPLQVGLVPERLGLPNVGERGGE